MRRYQRRLIVTTAVIAALFGVYQGAAWNWGKPDAAGPIIYVYPPNEWTRGKLSGSIRVGDCNFILNTHTPLLERHGVFLRRIAFSDLKPGQQAHVWLTYPILESSPARAGTRLVIIQSP